MKKSEFIFDSVDLLYYNVHRISLNRGGSYIVSPNWLKNKKAATNPKINDDKCFQYAGTPALNHEQIKKDPERISKIKPFIDQYNWREIEFPSHKKDWKRFALNKEVFVIKKVKNTVPWTYFIRDLNGEEIIGTFYETEIQKKQIKKNLD